MVTAQISSFIFATSFIILKFLLLLGVIEWGIAPAVESFIFALLWFVSFSVAVSAEQKGTDPGRGRLKK